jgi:hypothetical protein
MNIGPVAILHGHGHKRVVNLERAYSHFRMPRGKSYLGEL